MSELLISYVLENLCLDQIIISTNLKAHTHKHSMVGTLVSPCYYR
jgi:hypothetical protein